VNAHVLRGLQTAGKGELETALDDLVAALDYPTNLGVDRPTKDPKASRTEYHIGITLEALGNSDEAKTHFENAANNDVGGTEFRYEKGRAHAKLGHTDEAQKLFDALIADGTKQRDEGAKVDFFAAFGEKTSHNKQMAQAHFLIALGHLGKGEIEAANAAFTEALTFDPNHLWAGVYAKTAQ
jgi:tetratricopeptide (TPR) repeat protein